MTMSDVRDSPEFSLSCHCYDGVMVPIGNLESAHMNSKQPRLPEVRAQIISLITARGRKDRYAALLSRCRTSAARDCFRVTRIGFV
jgi:hypothetical protein